MNNITEELEMAKLVFKIRKIRLLSSAPRKIIRTLENIQLFNIIEEKLSSIPKYDEEW